MKHEKMYSVIMLQTQILSLTIPGHILKNIQCQYSRKEEKTNKPR